jgi:hypothetical protein
MRLSRVGHQAVRLQDGRVLVAGGESTNVTATAELFDPATGTFTPTGNMGTPRTTFAATLLGDGRVLVTGGFGPSTVQQTAELLDPTSRRFQSTGQLTGPRQLHAAVRLPDGRVVLLGGLDRNNEFVTAVEIYDPATGRFARHGELVEGHSEPTATLLPDGRILVVGGFSEIVNRDWASEDSVEVYDPTTGQSTVTDRLPEPRAGHAAATLSDGRVLIVGGVHRKLGAPSRPLTSVLLIDPVTGKVIPTDLTTSPRGWPMAAELGDGRVLLAGGWDGKASVDSAEVYIPGS